MTRYPFISRTAGSNGRKRRVIVEAENYSPALDKVLSIIPNKFINTKHAKAMVLIEADVEAGSRSLKTGKRTYVLVKESDGEAVVSSKLLPGHTVNSAYENGKKVKLTEVEEDGPPATTAQNKAKAMAKKSPDAVRKESDKYIEPKTKQVMSTKAKTPAKKTAKKVVKKATEKGPEKFARGNNMFLTAAEWKKVDTLLEKEGVSFSAWSRALVQAKIK